MMLCAIYSTILCLPEPAPTSQPWRFDVASALIGAAAALLLTGLVYYFRDALRLAWKAALAPPARLSRRLQASVEDRYRDLVATRACSLITSVCTASSDIVFVEPELLAPVPLPQSLSDQEIERAMTGHLALPLRQILGGHPKLIILGRPGAGRTTLLAYIALACARTVGGAETGLTPKSVRERLPLYVLLSAMDWNRTDDEDGRESDGVDRLTGAAVAAIGGGRGMMRLLRRRLEAGQTIVLADGWDGLAPQQRQRAAAWLSELIDALPGNLWLVGAGRRGYAPLTEAGFVPLTLAAWGARQVELFAEQWAEAYTPTDGKPPVVVRQLAAMLRRATLAGSSPLELALRAFVYFSDGQSPAKRAPLFDRALDLLLGAEEESWLLAACRAALEQVALSLQQEGLVTVSREELDAAVESALPPPEERPARATTRVFRALTGERGLLRPVGSDRYTFAHPLWQAYLAARQLVAFDLGSLIEWLDDPGWAETFRFYAELGDMGPLVAAWLRDPDDVFHTRLCTISSWISVAPEDAAWRNGAMAVLARSFLQPACLPQARQALAEALAATGMPGVTYLFKQALQHSNAEVRVAAVLGLTRTAQESDLPALEMALEDEEPAVREAVVRGLARLGTDAATRWLARILMEADESLSLVAAEALAQCGEEGAAFLREAIESEDTIARRAAVIGLAQTGARELLEKVAREDEQWIVRSAALAAVDEMEERARVSGIAPPPEIEQLPWLISWAATQGEGVGLGDAARRMLWRALNEGDAPVRLAAAQVLTQIGRPDDVEPLRAALDAPDASVADAVWGALAEIGRRYELRIE